MQNTRTCLEWLLLVLGLASGCSLNPNGPGTVSVFVASNEELQRLDPRLSQSSVDAVWRSSTGDRLFIRSGDRIFKIGVRQTEIETGGRARVLNDEGRVLYWAEGKNIRFPDGTLVDGSDYWAACPGGEYFCVYEPQRRRVRLYSASSPQKALWEYSGGVRRIFYIPAQTSASPEIRDGDKSRATVRKARVVLSDVEPQNVLFRPYKSVVYEFEVEPPGLRFLGKHEVAGPVQDISPKGDKYVYTGGLTYIWPQYFVARYGSKLGSSVSQASDRVLFLDAELAHELKQRMSPRATKGGTVD